MFLNMNAISFAVPTVDFTFYAVCSFLPTLSPCFEMEPDSVNKQPMSPIHHEQISLIETSLLLQVKDHKTRVTPHTTFLLHLLRLLILKTFGLMSLFEAQETLVGHDHSKYNLRRNVLQLRPRSDSPPDSAITTILV